MQASLFLTLLLVLFTNPTAAAGPEAKAETKKTVLITGANRGIGLALAERFIAKGYHVIGTARTPSKASALRALGATVEKLDVAEQSSVNAMAKRLEETPIDIVINNAGIVGHNEKNFSDLNIDAIQETFNVNTLGPLRVTQALLANLAQSDRKLVVNISSRMGSMEANTWGCCIAYRASKAALNSANKTLAVDLKDQGLSFVVLHPGYVKTDMNSGEGDYTAEQSASGLLKVILGLSPSDSGNFYDHLGKQLAW
ncbi:MAG: SDR family oxidoreductase [Pseudomonadales bacterium]